LSIRAKLALIFSLIVSIILILNTTLNYYSTRDLLRGNYETQMELLVKSIAISVEQSQFGSKYIEDLLGHELRTASIAAKYALNPDVEQVTNDELVRLSKELDISHMTLFAGTKSSNPKEINMSTKKWDYWFTAFQQLFDHRQVNIPEGQKLANYWSGPFNISFSDPNYVDKWGYFYDGTTNYIIDPFIRANSLQEFGKATGPKGLIEGMMRDNPGFLEITGFNPKIFGEKSQNAINFNGVDVVPLDRRPILFGESTYVLEKKDVFEVRKAITSNKVISFEAKINDKNVIKSFVPVQAENPYVIGIVMDYNMIQDVLNQHLLRNAIISIILLIFVFSFSYFFSGYVVKPVLQIKNKVKEIAEGHFGVHIHNKRQDELGLLADGVNMMSSNLAIYKNQLEYLAYYDDLTELPNRRLFDERLNFFLHQADENGKQLAVMFFDLDRFKSVNDIFGHTIGDRLLKDVGQRVKTHLGSVGTLFRMGGDEFTIILPDITRDAAKELADHLVNLMASPFRIEGYEICVTPSIGISLYPEDAENAELLLRNTDAAMYRAKNQGKNNYQFFIPEINESISRRVQLEKDLHKALENKEIVLYYQPQVDIRSGEINGIEALVRWQHPDLGLISPGEFIPLAEESGLIIPLGEWVLRSACNQMKNWQKAGNPLLRVAVNLSARQFQQGNLADTVTKVLQETGLDPQYLELEITESMAIHDADFTITKLQQLKQIGIQISMDDFGTGYSSLSYLKMFPIDKLKIDKSFVDDISIDQDNEIMIKTIITMAHNLKLNVIAEGVETEEQLIFLKEEKCDEFQGYLFSKPLSVEEFEKQFKYNAI
jgi:diguanylate cyclase (GGDEF)-like protein